MTLDRTLSADVLWPIGKHTVVWDGSTGQGVFHVPSAKKALPILLEIVTAQGASLLSLETHPATLEDLFLSFTGERLSKS